MKIVFAVACALALLSGCLQEALPPLPAKVPPVPLKAKETEGRAVAPEKNITGEPKENLTALAVGATPVSLPQNATDGKNESGMANATEEEYDPSKLQVDYYFSPLCPFSNSLSPKIRELQSEYANGSQWHAFDVLSLEGYGAFDSMALENSLSNSSRVVPLVVIGKPEGKRMFFGIVEISQGLQGELQNWTENRSG